MLHKSTVWGDALWCACNNYDEYLKFIKELYQYNVRTGCFGGELIDYEYPWVNGIYDLIDIFGIESHNEEEYSDDYDVEKLLNECEIEDKPEENEYPVVVYVFKNMHSELQIDWYSINTLLRRDADGDTKTCK